MVKFLDIREFSKPFNVDDPKIKPLFKRLEGKKPPEEIGKGRRLKDRAKKKSFDITEITSVKVIGVPIGKPTDPPIDGDGDGKYTLFPGAGDVTPLPPEGINVIELAKKVKNRLDEIENSVTREYGPLQSRKNIRDALNKAFPNAQIDGFLSPRRGDEAIDKKRRSLALGMLHVAQSNKDAAARLDSISADGRLIEPGERPYGGVAALGWSPDKNGMVMLVDFAAVLVDPMSRITSKDVYRDGSGHYVKAMYALQQTGASKEEIAHVMRLGTAIHEMGHVKHYNAVLKELKVEVDGSLIPMALMKEAGLSNTQIQSMFQGAMQAMEQNEPQMFARLSPAQQMQIATAMILDLVGRDLIQAAKEKWARDKLNPTQGAKAEREMRKVSRYAETDMYEAYAEFFTGLELEGGNPVPIDKEAQQLLDWVDGKAVDVRKYMESKQEPWFVRMCTGIQAPVKDPKIPKID